MRKFVRKVTDKVKDEVVKARKTVEDQISDTGKYVRQKAKDAENYVKGKGSELGSKAKAKVSDLKGRAKSAVEDLKNDPKLKKDINDIKESFDSDVKEKLDDGRYYAKDGKIKEKSLLHRAMDNPGKTALVASPAALGFALSGDDEDEDIMEEIKRKIRDDEPLSASEKRLLRLMEE